MACEYSYANDTEAAIGIGGLVFTKSANIEMRSEELYVSSETIKVKYRFYNNSHSDVRTHVAFPMPDVPPDLSDDNPGLSEHEFSTRVNGVLVTTQKQQQATVGGLERTDILKRFGVPLDPGEAQLALDNLPRQSWDELIKAGVVYHFEGKPTEHLIPHWTLKTAYYWEQTFPAKKEITIEHRYRPMVGGYSAGMSDSKKWSAMRVGDSLFLDYQKEYCIDQDFVRSAGQRERQRDRAWGEQWIRYILATGRNWASPIGEFRLVVDKGDPLNLVSFCAQGVKKISATQFEVRKRNFVPSTDLDVLILTMEADSGEVQNTLSSQTDVNTLSCSQLWHQRNSIFKSAGYCFSSRRAIATFGNAGCVHDNILDVPLSDRDRQSINAIQAAERMKRCPR